jgi:hypothetical protein
MNLNLRVFVKATTFQAETLLHNHLCGKPGDIDDETGSDPIDLCGTRACHQICCLEKIISNQS